jgi:hypothetical protein
MSVRNRLAGCRADVDADGETVRPKFLPKVLAYQSDQTPHVQLFSSREGKQVGLMSARNDQSVAPADRITVGYRASVRSRFEYRSFAQALAKSAAHFSRILLSRILRPPCLHAGLGLGGLSSRLRRLERF